MMQLQDHALSQPLREGTMNIMIKRPEVKRPALPPADCGGQDGDRLYFRGARTGRRGGRRGWPLDTGLRHHIQTLANLNHQPVDDSDSETQTKPGGTVMITNKQLDEYCRGMYDAWNQGNMDRFYAGLMDDVVDHNAGEGETGREGVQDALDVVRSAFPDHRYEVLEVIPNAEQKSFVVRLRASGTHQGDLFGIEPSGKHAEWIEARFIKVEENPNSPWGVATAEHWAVTDSLAMMTQLGHVPQPGQRESW
jgi:predicted ester cyclase